MKVQNKLFLATTISLVAFQAMSPTEFLSATHSRRMPAAEQDSSKTAEVDSSKGADVIVCKSENKGEQLEADVKKLIEDNESVVNKVDDPKKDNSELKLNVTSEVKPEVKKSENAELIALMGQMTSMFTAQMQMQMQIQIQIQMMSMFSQMSGGMSMGPHSPYASQYPIESQYGGGYPTFSDSLNYRSYGIGLRAPASAWSGYQNPYVEMPDLSRQYISNPSEPFILQAPSFQGYNFAQPAGAPVAPQLPELERKQISSPVVLQRA